MKINWTELKRELKMQEESDPGTLDKTIEIIKAIVAGEQSDYPEEQLQLELLMRPMKEEGQKEYLLALLIRWQKEFKEEAYDNN